MGISVFHRHDYLLFDDFVLQTIKMITNTRTPKSTAKDTATATPAIAPALDLSSGNGILNIIVKVLLLENMTTPLSSSPQTDHSTYLKGAVGT